MEPPSGASPADAAPQTPQDLTLFVQQLLGEMQSKFQDMSDAILSKIDEMGTKITELEKSVGELMSQAGIEPPPQER